MVYAYLNRCAHRRLELDWLPCHYFDAAGEYLICAAHGARYFPATGLCAGGPCGGGRLIALPIAEARGVVVLQPEDKLHLVFVETIPNT